ncbi:TetR/AcrR family transcriptional regulator [Nonomuraea insulae]|uniref:TetR/AcrR family transcriptional regulator n=1 Tax=Nonomuraea insulae TaxID=1616787 RepID=A0ABW1DEK1_9ACTN
MTKDPRRARRPSEALRRDIQQAMIDELVEHGYGEVSIEGVAARAGAAKTSVYRYWATKEELVIDALANALPLPDRGPSTGSVRGDFAVMMSLMAQSLGGLAGQVLLTVAAERRRHPEVAEAVMERVVRPRQRLMLEALDRAVARGEIPAEAARALPVQVAGSLLLQHFMHTGTPPGPDEIDDYLDRAVMPVLNRK